MNLGPLSKLACSRWTLVGALVCGSLMMAACTSSTAETFGPDDSGPDGAARSATDSAPPDRGLPGTTGSEADTGATIVADAAEGPDSGNTGAADAGNTGPPDATTTADARTPVDAGAARDATGPTSDAGICADQAVWLTPMNLAREMVGEAPLVCDPIAAQVALNYANKCGYAHNANRSSDYSALGGTGGLGENIAAGAPTESIAIAVSSWVSEIQFYTHATNTCSATPPASCGHYTQIVWKATTAVGCAHVSCTTNSPFGSGGNGRWDFSVCDYSPPGNYVGQPPY